VADLIIPEFNITVPDVKVGEEAKVIVELPENASGNVIALVDGRNVAAMIVSGGTVELPLGELSAGKHMVMAIYSGNGRYIRAGAEKEIDVEKLSTNLTAESVDIMVGEIAIINVELPENVTGVVFADIEGNLYCSDVGSGSTFISVEGLSAGNYTALITYPGDDRYAGANATIDVKVTDLADPMINITVPDVKVGEEAKVIVELPENASGNVIALVDGRNVAAMIVSSGTVVLPLGELSAGEHMVSVVYSGNDKYIRAGAEKEFAVDKLSTTITVNSVVIKEGETAKFIVAVDENATGYVLVDVSGSKFFDVVVGGIAEVDAIGLTAGNYAVLIAYMGDENYNGNATLGTALVEKMDSNVNITIPSDIKVGEDVPIAVDVPGATGNVTVIVDGEETVIPLVDGKANYTVPAIAAGDHSIVVIYSGDKTHDSAYNAASVSIVVLPTEFTDITVFGDLNITARLVDSNGNPVANAVIDYTVGDLIGNVTTGADGSFVIAGQNNAVIAIKYAGNATLFATNTSITLDNIAPVVVQVTAHFDIPNNATTVRGYAIDKKAGEEGVAYATTLLDANGKPISGVPIQFGVNSKIYSRTTYENGSFYPYHLNMVRAGVYTLAFSFAGNENYTSAFAIAALNLAKKPIKIKASNKSFKSSATKKYTITLSTIVGSSADGKAHLRSGMKVTMRIDGKTYTSKTNSKGQVTFNLKITKKGKFSATISTLEDQTYETTTKSVKITIN